MKFLVILCVVLAVAAGTPESEGGLFSKLSRWLHFDTPSFAPIRTTPKPFSSEDVPNLSDEEAKVREALKELYNNDKLKDVLPPLSSLFNRDESRPHPLRRPLDEIKDPQVANLIQTILNYLEKKPQGSDSPQEVVEPEPKTK